MDDCSKLRNSACYDDAQIKHYMQTIEDNGDPPVDLAAVSIETLEMIDSPVIWSAITGLAGVLMQAKQLQDDDLAHVLSQYAFA
ncbi:hypothetical protein [Geomesophilobacter sediminis]|uniref:Uncharacterized protein n=1 Tax=Geomesophilobacter sediminis TaxID=2798584 RepID=A0A8J7M1X9_9BACT|nr:hypothetical protein [Geomesophilobacter sediminis]MBJ6727190.1 hypothetical protein [Geomesophilobacter sediminis]